MPPLKTKRRSALPKTSFPKKKIKILLLENIHPAGIERFRAEGYIVDSVPKSLPEEELCRRIGDVHLLGIRSKTQLSKSVLAAAPKLLAAGAFCIGTDQIDLKSAVMKGVPAFNAPYSNTRSVVELVIGEIIMLMRRTFEKSGHLHRGTWDKSADGSYEIRGKTIGIIGYGNIGSQISILSEALGMEVLYYDIIEKLAYGNAKKCASLKELLTRSDIVTVHAAGLPGNKNLIGEKEFRLMKKGAVFLNLSRGFIVDIAALAKNLSNGHLAGAAVDVYPQEPHGSDELFASELQGMPNVILTPHVGGSTLEAQKNIAEFVSKNLITFVNTGNTMFSVNFPNIQLDEVTDRHRFIHIHENVPGIMAKINSVFARNNINILAQYLKTNDLIGYVITDVSKEYDSKVVNELKGIQQTVRFRALY